jgi:hypothetical protein
MSVYDFLSARRIRGRCGRPKDTYILSTLESNDANLEEEEDSQREIKHAESFFDMNWEDRNSVLLLLMLYTLQGT